MLPCLVNWNRLRTVLWGQRTQVGASKHADCARSRMWILGLANLAFCKKSWRLVFPFIMFEMFVKTHGQYTDKDCIPEITVQCTSIYVSCSDHCYFFIGCLESYRGLVEPQPKNLPQWSPFADFSVWWPLHLDRWIVTRDEGGLALPHLQQTQGV